MKDRLVCIKDDNQNKLLPQIVKGEIYTFLQNSLYDGYICLVEFGSSYAFLETSFRPVDLSYGPAVCQTIEQQIELERVLI